MVFLRAVSFRCRNTKRVNLVVPLLAITALLLGGGLAFYLYRTRETDPINAAILRRRFYFDEFYAWLIEWTQGLLSRLAAFCDRWIIDAGAVRGASGATWGTGFALALASGRQPAGLRVSLRPWHCLGSSTSPFSADAVAHRFCTHRCRDRDLVWRTRATNCHRRRHDRADRRRVAPLQIR